MPGCGSWRILQWGFKKIQDPAIIELDREKDCHLIGDKNILREEDRDGDDDERTRGDGSAEQTE